MEEPSTNKRKPDSEENNNNKRARKDVCNVNIRKRPSNEDEASRKRIRRNSLSEQAKEVNLQLRRLQYAKKFSSKKRLARDEFSNPKENYLGKMNCKCKFCGAHHFEKEKNRNQNYTSCCSSGMISVQLPNYPEPLRSWLDNQRQTEDGRNFILQARKYNSAFAFASFGHTPVQFSSGPQTFVIHGQIYHLTSSAVQSDEPSYSQLYILDPDCANKIRLETEFNQNCKEKTMQIIDSILRRINPYASAYKMMKNVLDSTPDNEKKLINMWITSERILDQQRYNFPTVNEIAAVFNTTDGEPPFNRDICIHPASDTGLQRIQITSPNCDPMVYPILFPYGELGWHNKRQKQNGERLTMQEYYGYLIQERQAPPAETLDEQLGNLQLQERPGFNQLLHAGRLTQQFIVDAFLKIESNRLNWFRVNQKDLRVEQYLGLMDYVQKEANKQNVKAGKYVSCRHHLLEVSVRSNKIIKTP